ncbi:hypothetical protein F0919_08090 [Taibaiella lutea]|uniref:Uncharacterized protein n=1 Tax=Taibaiella lutea TaxID=2608001 RepID=A0A5M6CKR5_9BACT|nr:hypothetical protein [Taibaiella lutea]KAA5534572.1 hypothetical protein F0919_08090 [Taibaiella lutea]
MKQYILYISAISILLASCGGEKSTSKGGAIILGDSSTIVTEKDSQYLKDDILDFEPNNVVSTQSSKADTVVKAAAPVEKPQEPVQQPSKATAAGYSINFGNVKIVFEGIAANDATRQNAEKQDGLSYVIKSGSLAGAKIHVYGAKNATIRQRYQSRLMLNSKSGSVDLRNLGLYTTGWKNVNASKTGAEYVFALTDLNNISFSNVNNAKIKNATDKELRNRRTSKKTIQSWMKEISKTNSANDNPCDIILDNLQLQISGTGADGKSFRKNIRMSA